VEAREARAVGEREAAAAAAAGEAAAAAEEARRTAARAADAGLARLATVVGPANQP